ncbi:MAG: Fic family protein [Firmicutes bacterium]|nr:Fic family protein [Bacillota bacterium]
MYNEIRNKKERLKSRMPFSAAVTADIARMNLEDMLYTGLRLSGSELSREQVRAMLAGEVVREATVYEHVAMERYRELLNEMVNLSEMQNSLNLDTLLHLYGILTDSDTSENVYRRNDPVVYELSYNPPDFLDVPEQMDILMKWMARENSESESEFQGNELLKAAHFHCRLIEIFPFKEGNRDIARIGLYYYMMSKGYPVFSFNFSESEYNSAIAAYLKREDIAPLYNGLERSLFNKLDMMEMMTTGENED